MGVILRRLSGRWACFLGKTAIPTRTNSTIFNKHGKKKNFNQLIIKQFEKIWDATGKLPSWKIQMDMDTEFERLKGRIRAEL